MVVGDVSAMELIHSLRGAHETDQSEFDEECNLNGDVLCKALVSVNVIEWHSCMNGNLVYLSNSRNIGSGSEENEHISIVSACLAEFVVLVENSAQSQRCDNGNCSTVNSCFTPDHVGEGVHWILETDKLNSEGCR